MDKTMDNPFAETFKKQMKYMLTPLIPGPNLLIFLVSHNEETSVYRSRVRTEPNSSSARLLSIQTN